ncbi:MAG: hypothetical protein HYX55_09200 [Chloroflexi bacterium]|nr:hypothetical protein [Chloroflexota bacterium]
MTEYFDRDLAALDEIENLLEAYADARLSPAGLVLARMRAQVLREAALRSAIAATAQRAAETDVARRSRWGLPGFRVPQRAFALGLAATLTLGTSAAVLAAPPGSPFYNARVAIETAFLPSQVDARLASHERLLTERLAEAEAAARRGDLSALAAALAAYQAEVEATVTDVGDDVDRLARLEAELSKHTAVLEALTATLPEQAAIEHAIDASQKATAKLKDKGAHGGRPSTPPGAPENAPTR